MRTELEKLKIAAGLIVTFGLAAVGCQASREEVLPPPTETPIEPTPVPTQTIVFPPPTPTALPTPEAKEKTTLFEALTSPFVKEAALRRDQRAKNDPEWSQRVDRELNENRVNFLFFGRGWSHEPPATYKANVGAFTILSYDQKSGTYHRVSLSHDLHDPKLSLERFRRFGVINPDTRIDKAYNAGGFERMRKTMEEATGLSMDYQVVFSDSELARLIELVGGLNVEVKIDTKLYPYWYYDENKKDFVLSPIRDYAQGVHHMSGWEAVGYIASVPIEETYSKLREHHVREEAVIDALVKAFENKNANIVKAANFWPGFIGFIKDALSKKGIAYDFDVDGLLLHNLDTMVSNMGKFILQSSPNTLGIPRKGFQVYIADPRSATVPEGYVSPVVRYGGDMYIPAGADPYTDHTVEQYWGPLRKFIKAVLSKAIVPQ